MRPPLITACAIAALAASAHARPSQTSPDGLGFLSGSARTTAFGSATIENVGTGQVQEPSAFEEDDQNVDRTLNFTASSDTDGGLAELFPQLAGSGSFGFASGSIASRFTGLEIFVDVGAIGDSISNEMVSNRQGDFLVSGNFNADANIDIIIQVPELLEILGGNFGTFNPGFGGFDTGLYFFAPAGSNPGQIIEDSTLYPATGFALAPGTYSLTAFIESFSKSADRSDVGWTMSLPDTTLLPTPGAAGLLALAGAYTSRRRRRG